ncbi:pimeloyl-ACP methyl ester carboxylesterase [Neorhizobium huautlense]|uniref:Pimeloyl-ACP methyl ester carboxylesterase n=1 Tax=Neorhizobium huautlense TaxID=67774 RepID=A0ABT9Q3F4_9HYPH|nr:alpha/beta hydrolase [Neorhizobium huautlense]MDP9840489.1 pimeloyl-ACP methyl ester carboxylesterase [Neorhizobium huautlense]
MDSSQTSRIVDLESISLHIVEEGPANGEPVLMLHGFPEFWWAWRKQSSALAEAGFRVVMVDMRGYGQSEAPTDVSDYRIANLVDDIVRLASHLGWQRFNIVGHDWGGIVAWAVASLHPMRVKRLIVLNAPHIDVMADVLRKMPSQMVRSAYIAFFQLPSLPEALLSARRFKLLVDALTKTARPGSFTDDEIERYRQQWQVEGHLKAMLNYYRALIREARPALGRIVPPVLILWGCRDRALDFRLAKESLVQCANGRMCVHRSATHWVHLEEPEWTNGHIIRFLAEDHELDRPEPGLFQETA